MTQAEALAKVRKLLRLGESTNVHEAALAMARAQEIMERYRIEQSMLSLETPGSEEPDEPIEDFGNKDAELDAGLLRRQWKISLASHLARHNQCRIYLSRKWRAQKSHHTIELVGRPTDADTVRYLFGYICRELERLVAEAGKGCGKTWRANFLLGGVQCVGDRLREMREQVRKDVQADRDSRALVVVSQALAKLDERGTAVEKWMKENMRLGRSRASAGRYDGGARRSGYEAAKSINLSGGGRAIGRGPAGYLK